MICNIVRIVHRMCKQGHQFKNPLDIKSIGDESLENPEVLPAVVKPQETKQEAKEQLKQEAKQELKQELKQEAKQEVKQEVKQELKQEIRPEIGTTIKQDTTEVLQKVSPIETENIQANHEIEQPVYTDQVYPTYQNSKIPMYEETKIPIYEESKIPISNKAIIPAQINPIVDQYQNYDDYGAPQSVPQNTNEYVQPQYERQGYYDDRRRERVSYYDQMPRGPSNRERSPVVQTRGYSDENTIKYVRARNLPTNWDKSGIIEFFSSIPIAFANIALVYDQTGRFWQEAILALNNLNDQIEAVYQSGRYIFNYQVFVEEATPSEWEHAQQTQKVFFNRDERILVRMRGLPYSIKKEEILAFFHGYDVVPDSVIIGEMGNGKKTGEGVILFKSEEEAQRAVNDRNGSSIGRRWIELYLHPYSHFHNFFQAQHHEEFVYLNKYITEENKFRALRLRGLPYNVTKKDILSFFKDFPLSDSDVIFEVKEGRATGRALVFLWWIQLLQ